MQLWTIQHRNAYDKMLRTGFLRADEQYFMCKDDPLFLSAYDWMAEQMTRRIGPPPVDIKYPVWAWYRWEGKRSRPDMRKHRYWCEKKNTPIVLLTLDIPASQVLLSDFDMWHCVLNHSFCPRSPETDIIQPTQEEILKSWDNIFRYELVTDYWTPPKTTQATFWNLKEEWVRKAEHFISA